MNETILIIHSWLRWAVVIFGVMAILRAYQGWQQNRPFEAADKRINTIFIASLHTQLVLGLVLYFFTSQFGAATFQSASMGAIMKVKILRYWAVEHFATMILGIAVAQIGSIKSKKQADDTARHRVAFKWFLAGMLILGIGIVTVVTTGGRGWFKF